MIIKEAPKWWDDELPGSLWNVTLSFSGTNGAGGGGGGGGIVFVGQFGGLFDCSPSSSSTSTNDMMRSFRSGSLTLTRSVLTKFCRNRILILTHDILYIHTLFWDPYFFIIIYSFFFLMSARGGAPAAAAAGVFFLDFIPNCFFGVLFMYCL